MSSPVVTKFMSQSEFYRIECETSRGCGGNGNSIRIGMGMGWEYESYGNTHVGTLCELSYGNTIENPIWE